MTVPLGKSVSKTYASVSKPSELFSNLYKYFTIDIIIEKYIGKRPVSERTSKFEECLFAPKIYFKNLICDLSAISPQIKTHYPFCMLHSSF